MPPTATMPATAQAAAKADANGAEQPLHVTDQFHTAVTSALDIASSTLFGPYPEVDITNYDPSNGGDDDDGISVLSGFASAGGHSHPSSRPNSPPPTPPRTKGAAGKGAKALLTSVKEAEGASPTSVRKTPGNVNTTAAAAVPGTPPHNPRASQNHNPSSSSPTAKPSSPPKTTNVAAAASSPGGASDGTPPPQQQSPAFLAYSQARAEYERSEAAAEERSALLSATGGVEVQMFPGADADGAGEGDEEGGDNSNGNDDVGRTRSEVELDSFAFELESAIGLESGFSVTYGAAGAFAAKAAGGGGETEEEKEEKEERALPTTFEEEALKNEADMVAADAGEEKKEEDEEEEAKEEAKAKVKVDGDGGSPDNKEATSTNDCDVLGCFGGGAAAATAAAGTAGADDSATAVAPRFTLPTSMAEFEGFLTGLADSTNEAMAVATSPCAGCLGREPAKADEQNENDAIEVEALSMPEESGSTNGADGAANGADDAAAGDDDAPLVRISAGPVDIDEVSHTSLLEEFGLNELNMDDTSNEGEETKKVADKAQEEEDDPAISDAYAYDNANTDSMDSQTDKSEQKKRVTIIEDPIEVASIASSDGASSLPSSPDPIPRRVGGKTDEESTVISLTFKPPSQKKKKNKKKKQQKMMAALGMTTGAAATAAAVAAPVVETAAAPTATSANTNDTAKSNDDEMMKSPKKTLSTKKMFSSFKKAMSTKKIGGSSTPAPTVAAAVTTATTTMGPAATIRMISGCADEETSAGTQNISTFALPNPNGKASGACTSALLKALHDAQGSENPSAELTYVNVLTKMHADLKESGFEQIPQLTSSKSLNIKDAFQLNDGKGTARALLVGINYSGEENELSGCHDDVKKMHQYLTEVAGFDEDEIMVLMDDGECPRPSKKNIINAWKELVEESEDGDSVYFHFSGHGGRVRVDESSEEIDGCAETICPVDYAMAGQIRDDDIYKGLCEPMAKGVTVTMLMDSCNNCNVLDLPYTLEANEAGKKNFMSLQTTSKTAKYFGEYAADGKKNISTHVTTEIAPPTPMRTVSAKDDDKEMPSTPSTDVSMGSMSDDEDDAASKASC